MPVLMNEHEEGFRIQTGQIKHADIEDDEVEIVDPDALGIDELWDHFHQHNEGFVALGRKSVQEAWLAGHVLCGLKEKIPHGEWLNALDDQDIANQTANRYMRLRRAYDEIPLVEEFDSITEAMAALQLTKSDLWDSIGEGEGGGSIPVNVSDDEDDFEPEDASWEIMQKAVEKAREGFNVCDDKQERYQLANVLLGWLAGLNDEMREAIHNYGREIDGTGEEDERASS